MESKLKTTPRTFEVGIDQKITISDWGELHLDTNDLVTFVNPNGKRHDFTAKDWGFYATPSINGRLQREGYKTALVRNESGQHFIMVVDAEMMNAFEAYCTTEKQEVVEWLDERS